MTAKERMIKALTDLLKPGETLMYPVYGSLYQGDAEYYGYFGLTENYLLIALISGGTVENTIRVPLNIKSLEIKKSLFLKQHIIDITFKKGAPCLFGVFPRVIGINSQKNNLRGFVNCLKNKTPAKRFPELKDMKGIKLRKQYFSMVLYIIFCIVFFAFVGAIAGGLKENKLDLFEILDIVAAVGIIFSPLLVLAVFNVFLYGKVLGVINKDGLYFENDFIPWQEIESVVYDLKLPSRRGAGYRCATIYAGTSLRERHSFDVYDFPIYGLGVIKKYCSKAKIRFAKGVSRELLLYPAISVFIAGLYFFVKF